MDINMNNIVLFKDGNWIKIRTGELNGNPVGVKLAYDDGTNPSFLANIQDRFYMLINNNSLDFIDDVTGTLE